MTTTSVPRSGSRRSRWVLGAFAVGIVVSPVAKWVQFKCFEGSGHWRQLGLIAAGALAVAVTSRRPLEAVVTSQLALPRPPQAQMFSRPRLGRTGLAVLAVSLCGMSVVAAVSGDRVSTVGFTAGGLLVVVFLCAWEAGRHLHARATRTMDPGPDRAVLWAVVPGVLWWTILLVQGAVRGSDFNGSLAGQQLFLGGAAGEALFTVLVIGLGEEYLYRGLLLVLAVRAQLQTVGLVLISLSFGFWHLPDALGKGEAMMVLTVAGMTIASQLILIPIRLRCRSLAGPALLHSANNLGLRMLSG